MTALLPLTTRLSMARVALVLPPQHCGPEAADFAAHGADLLILSKGGRSVEEATASVEQVRRRLFGLPTLVAADDVEVAARSAADVVFLARPGWRPFGYHRPHAYSLFGRSIAEVAEAGRIDGDPFNFGFLGPAITGDTAGPRLAEMAAEHPPFSLPAGPIWFAAGGISSATVGAVLATGARRVSVSRAVFKAADPFTETRLIAAAVRAAWAADEASRDYCAAALAL